MPMCMVPGCGNYLREVHQLHPGRNESYHRLPVDIEKRKEWLRVINNSHYDVNTQPNVLEGLRVCSLHFTEDDYNRNVQADLFGFGGSSKRTLKRSAVPTLFERDEPREKRVRMQVGLTVLANVG